MSDHPPTSNRHTPFHGRSILGSAALLFAAVVLSLAIIDEATGLPFNMPRTWYVNGPLWCFLGMGAFAAGCLLLRNRPHAVEWKPDSEGIRFEYLLLYTRERCCLCDNARDVLRAHGKYLPKIEEVDIDTDPRLVERFGTCVPVVEIDGKVRFRGEINQTLLRRMIEGTRPRM